MPPPSLGLEDGLLLLLPPARWPRLPNLDLAPSAAILSPHTHTDKTGEEGPQEMCKEEEGAIGTASGRITAQTGNESSGFPRTSSLIR